MKLVKEKVRNKKVGESSKLKYKVKKEQRYLACARVYLKLIV